MISIYSNISLILKNNIKMNDVYSCRICFEDFRDRNDVIVPCKCSGTQKYVCKECLNKYLNLDRNDNKYTTCPSCKSKYNREVPGVTLSLNDEIRDEALYAVGVITLITLGFLAGGKSSVYIFFVLCLYFYTIAVFVTATNRFGNVYWLILFVYLLVLFAPKRISYFIYGLWTIFMFGFVMKRLVGEKWELISKSKVLKLTRDMKCKMFDFDIGAYVPGIV